MSERLTKRNSDGSVGISALRYYNYDDFQKMAQKLAYYEDLEEQGRLLIFPENFHMQRFKEVVAERYCPSHFDLFDLGCESGKSKKISDCMQCWKEAMEGE